MCIKCIYILHSTCVIYLGVPLEGHSNTWAGLDLWYSPMGTATDTKENISNVKQAAKWEFSSLQFKIGTPIFYLFTPYIYVGYCSRPAIFGSRAGKGITAQGTRPFGTTSSQHCLMCLTSWNEIAVMPCSRESCWCIVVCLILSLENYGSFAINSALHGKLCNVEQLPSAEIVLFWVKVRFQCQWSQEKLWVQSITSLSPLFCIDVDSLCTQIFFCFLVKRQWIENWHWLFRILWGLDPLGFLSLLQLNTSAFKKFVLTSEVGMSYHFAVVSVSSHLQKCGNHCRDQDCWSVQQEKLYPVHKSLSQVWKKSHAANQKMNFILNQNSDQQIYPGI